jgi:hypothetical protein
MVFKFDLYCHCFVFQNSKQEMISEISKVYHTTGGIFYFTYFTVLSALGYVTNY